MTWPAADDVQVIAAYVGGFAVAGGIAGAVGVDRGSRARGYAAFMLGGAAVVLAIMLADKGSLRALDGLDVAMVPVLGGAFGAAFARGWYRTP